jgi:hypothetical protein
MNCWSLIPSALLWIKRPHDAGKRWRESESLSLLIYEAGSVAIFHLTTLPAS